MQSIHFYNIFWYFIPLIIVVFLLNSSKVKGFLGELIINLSVKMFLNKKEYFLFKNVLLPSSKGATQIDHIIVSKYGIFVIETKNFKGWIFGKVNEKFWIQQIYKEKYKFQNPLHQNYKHIKVLSDLTGISMDEIFSLVVFVGDCTFKSKMPENVIYGLKFLNYIKSKKQPILSDTEITEIIYKIEKNRLPNTFKTKKEHVERLKEKKIGINIL